MATQYSKLKVIELKDLLKERGIPTAGLTRKQSIIDALEKRDSEASGSAVAVDAPEDSKEGEVEVKAAEEESGGGNVVRSDEVETGVEAQKVEGDATDMKEASALEPGTKDQGLDVLSDATTDPAPTAILEQPSVLEAGEPVSSKPTSELATPQQHSGTLEDASPESRKRKRRSPTPSLSEETVSKKLKATEQAGADPVKLSDDAVIEDAPVPLGGADGMDTEGAENTVQPYSSGNDLRDPNTEDVTMTDQPAIPDTSSARDSPTGAVHPATRALYIRDLIRPLQPTQLRDHLVALAGPDSTDSSIEQFHLDVLRTHAFAVFSTLKAATRVRAALHGTVFPDEPARKALWVDFVPEEKVPEWIDVEASAGTSRRDARKWEVVYGGSGEGTAVQHVEVGGAGRDGSIRQGSTTQAASTGTGAGGGMPNAPLGPRGNGTMIQRPSQSQPLADRTSTEPQEARNGDDERAVSVTANPATGPSASSFTTLAKTFLCTTTKPHLYYLPKPDELATSRLRALEQETSRDWTGARTGDGVGEGYGRGLRRYTFEDGDRLVDGGADRGSFGTFGGDGYGRGAYRGRGRGGYRGYGGYGGGGGAYRGR
ncbi:hypothetical protein B0A54_15234 [Friedmanniomyces endolithicus]|uniref:SAP domain-containing protein n=1 Tax=Friedmanniomyces endolithicus TaxID=329885 RepID=A0A4U0UHA6_9PEZI|nr:hypothetical protein B0A54_15234 [Friedmanniomyces endolithicus]